MKKSFTLLLILFSVQLLAQQPAHYPNLSDLWHYSPELSEEELYNYERLMFMPKEDWEMFRSDPRYDDARVRALYRENKGKIPGDGQAILKKLMPPGDCNCWIEPDDTYTQLDPVEWENCGGGGPGVDCWFGPINLQFDFCFYGQTMNQLYLTSKGTIVFGAGYFDWTPSEFPTPANAGEPEYDQICGFWADFDFRQSGEMHYKSTPDAFFLNYIDVGYWNNHEDKVNTFQIIIAADDNDDLPNGTNVQFCYQDMQWAHGDVGGGGGFGGPTPATVGADRLTGNSHIQFGRFNLSTNAYNGPYGQGNNQQDGINWLDYKVFDFSVCSSSQNIPPISTASVPCDTIFLCQGDSYDLNMQFLSPEAGQSTAIQTSQTGSGLTGNSTSGNTATYTGTFEAGPDNVGVNVVTITASDNGNPAGVTQLTFIFEVLDIVAPPISIDGNLGICAGGETLLTATAGFDSYEWSTGCDEQSCLVENGGNVTVTGYSGVCTSSASVVVDATDYFIPDLCSDNEPIILCPGQTATACTVEEYASYEWSVYDGYPGEIIPGTATDEQDFIVSGDTPGHYQVIVEDENGCEGFNIQIVEIIESFIDESNEENSGAYCDGLEPVEFSGGFSNPAQGLLTVYLISSSSLGFQGSYLLVDVTHTDGTTDQFVMSSSGLYTIATAPITVDDEICVTYVSSGVGDENNQVWIFNCSNQGQTIFGPGLTAGELWCGTSGCTSQPLFGEWSVEGPAGWSMTNMDEYNSTFTPGDYGLYTLCFTDPACNIEHCYELEYTEAPTLTLLPDNNILLCDDESEDFSIQIEDIGGTGEIVWSGTGLDVDSDELGATAGPYTGYVSTTVEASITNGCGTASASVTVEHQPDAAEPSLDDEFLCNGGSVLLDPVPSAQDNPNLEYDWSNGADTPTLNATQSGTYTVTVSNLCDTSNPASAEVTLVPPATLNPVPSANILECDESSVTLTVGVPNGYVIEWSTGSTQESINVESSGEYCYEVTDTEGCNTLVEGCSQVTISSDPTVTSSDPTPRILCPGECEVFDLEASSGATFTWTTNCSQLDPTSTAEALQFCSDQVPLECLDGPITVTGTATNACGTASASWVVQANGCSLRIPNVFTPNDDSVNNTFFIEGLENYPGTTLTIFNRWGSAIYESDSYENDWEGRDVPDGTYYYILVLPFGIQKEFEGYFTIMR